MLSVLSIVCIPGRSSAEQIAVPGAFALGFTAVALYRLFFQRHRWDRQHYTLIAALLNVLGIYMGVEAFLRQRALQAAQVPDSQQRSASLEAMRAVNGNQPVAPVPGGTYLDRAVARFDQQLRASPEISAYLDRSAASERVAQANALANRGMARLPAPLLVRRLELQLAMLARTEAETCADLAKGRGGAAPIERGLRTLDESELRDWFDGMFAAAEAAVRPSAEEPLSPREVETAFRALFAAAPAADAKRARRLLANDLALLPDVDACWLQRFLAQETLKIAEPQRSTIARALIAQ